MSRYETNSGQYINYLKYTDTGSIAGSSPGSFSSADTSTGVMIGVLPQNIILKTLHTAEDIILLKEYNKEEELDNWLTLAEPSFNFWDNEKDAYYDNL